MSIWTERDTSITVEIDDFDVGQMLQGLIDKGVLTETEAATVDKRAQKSGKISLILDSSFLIDPVEFELARADLCSGRRQDALIHLERALGGDFVGRLADA